MHATIVCMYTRGASKTEKNRWWIAEMTSSLNEEALEELNMKNKLTQHIIQIFEGNPQTWGKELSNMKFRQM